MVVSFVVLRPTIPSRGTKQGRPDPREDCGQSGKAPQNCPGEKRVGVTEHTVHKQDFGGLAYIATGRIIARGRKGRAAHKCGHIFLHNSEEF